MSNKHNGCSFRKIRFFFGEKFVFSGKIVPKIKMAGFRMVVGNFRYVTSHVTGQARKGRNSLVHTRQIWCTALRLAVQIIVQKEQK